MRLLEEISEQFSHQRVAVVGDVMLDAYIWGDVRRISPEAPVPVVEAKSRTYVPGGAANVALNVAGLGASVGLGGVVGSDASAETLAQLLASGGVDSGGLVLDSSRPTICKTRVMAHSQQMLRIDDESRAALQASVRDALLLWFSEQVGKVGAVVLSDYGKGVLHPPTVQALMEVAHSEGIPVVVDPKGTDYSRYAGATLLTPNLLEAERATGIEVHSEDDLRVCAEALLKLLPGTSVLITRGAQGMTLFEPERVSVHIPSVARTVYDVTGAGDTVVSVIALALAAGADLASAGRLANQAAGVVVGKLGTSTITVDELLEQLG